MRSSLFMGSGFSKLLLLARSRKIKKTLIVLQVWIPWRICIFRSTNATPTETSFYFSYVDYYHGPRHLLINHYRYCGLGVGQGRGWQAKAYLLYQPHSPRHGNVILIIAECISPFGLCSQKVEALFRGSHYYAAHKPPLKDILQRPEHSSRLKKWCIELSGQNINYDPHKVIKGQAIANFKAEVTPNDMAVVSNGHPPVEPSQPERDMYVNKASKASAPGGRVNLRGPLGMEYELGVTFQFSVTNNVVEYETLKAGLKMAGRSA